jgi:uncharacterized protein involved in type VI secretion and phage assembly
VVFAGNPEAAAVPARSLAALDYAAIGAEVALLFEDGDPRRPLIVGRIVEPSEPTALVLVRDGTRVQVTAQERLELRVGKASLVMEKDGRITIRGSYVTSHASATNRIRGGSVNLN